MALVTRSKEAWEQVIQRGVKAHRAERRITLESVYVCGELDQGFAALELRISESELARRIELSPAMYRNRVKAARVIRSYPEVVALIEAGEAEVSNVAAIAVKITSANAKILIEGIRNKAKREVEELLSVVTADGRLLEREPEIEIRAVLTKSQAEVLDRAREVLSHSGKVPTNAEVLVKALKDLLWKRDPLKVAQRAMKREAKRLSKNADPLAAMATTGPATAAADTEGNESVIPGSLSTDSVGSGPEKDEPTFPQSVIPGSRRTKRTKSPAAVRHAVEMRDLGQCTEILADGSRCPERFSLETDHRTPVCRGGKDTVENEGKCCRRHNQWKERQMLGEAYMVSWEESRDRAARRAQERASTRDKPLAHPD